MLRAWEIQAALKCGDTVRFELDSTEVIDRNSPPPGSKTLYADCGAYALSMVSVKFHVVRREYPPPQLHLRSRRLSKCCGIDFSSTATVRTYSQRWGMLASVQFKPKHLEGVKRVIKFVPGAENPRKNGGFLTARDFLVFLVIEAGFINLCPFLKW